MHTQKMTGVWTLDDRNDNIYRRLPVEVPRGSRSIAIALSYDRQAGVIDLGCSEDDNLRGWSGGARERFFLSEDRATPGYLPGPVDVGTLEVLLGLHKIPPAPLAYSVEITFDSPAPPEAKQAPLRASGVEGLVGSKERLGARRHLPAPSGWTWLAGDLHSHSEHSDGHLSVEEIAALAASRELDFLAVSDHNTVSHHAFLDAAARNSGVILLAAQEVTTHLGHANAIGTRRYVDFRRPAPTWWEQAADGIVSVNHPLAGDCSWRQSSLASGTIEASGLGIGFAELWHGAIGGQWLLATLGWGALWASANDCRLVPLGGSDWHRPGDPAPLGTPTTWVLAEEPSEAGVLAALRAGRTAISTDPRAPLLLPLEDRLVAVEASGSVVVGAGARRGVGAGERAELALSGGPFHLEDFAGNVIAISA